MITGKMVLGVIKLCGDAVANAVNTGVQISVGLIKFWKNIVVTSVRTGVDIVAQCIWLLAFIVLTTTLGAVAITLDFLDKTIVEYYRL